MSSLTGRVAQSSSSGLAPFLRSASGVCAALVIAGLILAERFGFALSIALPVIAAFSLQAALYCAAVSEAAREAVRSRCSRGQAAGRWIAVSVLPYVVYSAPTGLFDPSSAAKLVALCSCIVAPYVLFPVRHRGLAWQDWVVICALAFPMISGLSTLFRDVYLGFDPPAHRLDSLGKLMLIPIGLFAFLELRRLEGVGFRLAPRAEDWRVALRVSGIGLPWILAAGLATGFLKWSPPTAEYWAAVGGSVGKLLGIYFTTALAEEFLLRGVVQNLVRETTGRPLFARGAAAVLFGAVHLGRGRFPNLPHAATAGVLGWFCGRAYSQAGSVTAAMLVHALAVAGQELLFR